MNPLRLLKIYTRANRLLDLFTRASRDWDAHTAKGGPMSKSVLLSATFWINTLTAAADLMQVLPLPVGWSVPTLAVVNIALRVLKTSQPVHVLPPK